MSNWFLSKIKYKKEDDKGILRNVSESYLVDAVSFTEVEKRLFELLSPTINEFQVSNVTRSKINEVYRYSDSETWYRSKISYVSIDEDRGKEKKINNYMLLTANNVRQAYDRVGEKLKGMMIDYEIPEVVQVPIVEVFEFNKNIAAVPELAK